MPAEMYRFEPFEISSVRACWRSLIHHPRNPGFKLCCVEQDRRKECVKRVKLAADSEGVFGAAVRCAIKRSIRCRPWDRELLDNSTPNPYGRQAALLSEASTTRHVRHARRRI